MYIGLDIGTSGTKAANITADGNIIKFSQKKYNFSKTISGFRELDPVEVWDSIKECLANVADDDVKSITIDSLGEGIVAVDSHANPLYGGITGTDCRGNNEFKEIIEKVGKEKLTSITGQCLSSIYSANKIVWLKRHEHDIYDKSYKILNFADFAVFKLCGKAVTDESLASRTMLYDIHAHCWSEELVRLLDIDLKKLADVEKAGTVVGNIRKEIADELGLLNNIRIIIGAHDHLCNAIGSATCFEGDCTNTVGTTEGITALVNASGLNIDGIIQQNISFEPFVIPGIFNTIAWTNTSGALLRWYAQQINIETLDLNLVFDDLYRNMDLMPSSLLVLPHFSGSATPYMDNQSKGAFIGLTLSTTRYDVFKACIEGTNFEMLQIINIMSENGLKINKLTATGGACTPKLLQIKANVLGLQVNTVKEGQSGVLGGAILGAVADGCYPNIPTAINNMVRVGETYYPDPSDHKIYLEKYEIYKELYNSLKNINHQI